MFIITDLQLNSLNEVRDELKRQLSDFVYYLEEGWTYFNGSFYFISSFEKTWNDSRDDCLQRGAHLLIINSKAEQSFANRFKKYVWIGLTDSEREGTWKWVDGTALTTGYWSSGEPNGGKGENCGQIKSFDSENSWNDEGCSVSHFWICEKKVLA
ncbi:uncharacterized protein V6R79_012972 [Siganus canaliculatus]